jgi:hypothetical protein
MSEQREAEPLDSEAKADKLVTRDKLLEIIKDETGLCFTPGTMDQLCAPSRGEGPPIEGYLGKRPIYSRNKGIAWARARLRAQPYRLHPRNSAPATRWP